MKKIIVLLVADFLSAACTKETLPQPSPDSIFSLSETF